MSRSTRNAGNAIPAPPGKTKKKDLQGQQASMLGLVFISVHKIEDGTGENLFLLEVCFLGELISAHLRPELAAMRHKLTSGRYQGWSTQPKPLVGIALFPPQVRGSSGADHNTALTDHQYSLWRNRVSSNALGSVVRALVLEQPR